MLPLRQKFIGQKRLPAFSVRGFLAIDDDDTDDDDDAVIKNNSEDDRNEDGDGSLRMKDS